MPFPNNPLVTIVPVGYTPHNELHEDVNEDMNYLMDGGAGTANLVLATPDGAPGDADFRLLVAGDIPNLPASKITTGQLALARGGTNADLSATGGAGQVLKQATAGGNISVGLISAADLAALTIPTLFAGGGYNVNASGQTRYYGLFSNQTNATEASVQMKIPFACTIRNLNILSITAQPASGAIVFTVYKNGVATGITTTINASDPPAFYSDLVNSESFAAGDTITIQAANAATANSASIQSVSLECDVKLF